MRAGEFRSALAVASLAALAAGCGGGGGGGGGGATIAGGGSGGSPPNPTYAAGSYAAPATYAAYCAAPRAGTDPYNNGAPFPDRAGSVVWENFWIRSWVNAYYLWYTEVPDLNPASYSTTKTYFDANKTAAATASGTPKDQFHFIYPTAQWEAQSQAGVSIGYGLSFAVIAATTPRQVLVAYTEPAASGYPATSAGVHLARGASILAIDGVDLVNAGDATSVATLNAGLTPSQGGETHSFTVVDTPGAASRTVAMTAVSITETPVQGVRALATASGAVGYLLFNDHIATAESGLIAAVNTLAAAGIGDLVLDIRYNGGGYLDIASELAYMIAGPGPTNGKAFDRVTFNSKYPTTDPITGAALTPTPFWNQTQGFSMAAGQALPSLNLPRVFVLTGPDTCSASEAVVNGLRGVGVEVILIGSQTCGKPYGFYPQDNCGTTYFSIEFKGVNEVGFGDYSDGFVAQNTTSTSGVQIPGCSVADDYAHALGDPAESRLAAALAYRAAGPAGCPTPASGFGPPAGPLSVDGHVAKPEWLKNRILRQPH